jgi:hypothetical protein
VSTRLSGATNALSESGKTYENSHGDGIIRATAFKDKRPCRKTFEATHFPTIHPRNYQKSLEVTPISFNMTARDSTQSSSPLAQSSAPKPTTKTKPPYRQIRAHYDDTTITVYQAYSAAIGDAAVKEQKLSASPDFSYGRMTWIKPSWAWMCYRADYSYKDPRQARILAINIKHEHFIELLSHAYVGHGAASGEEVRVQWDPERTVRLGKLEYRSIQIGIGRQLSQKWVEKWIVSIEDVTERARELKRVVDEDKSIGLERLVEIGLVPVERPYAVPENIEKILKMDSIETET